MLTRVTGLLIRIGDSIGGVDRTRDPTVQLCFACQVEPADGICDGPGYGDRKFCDLNLCRRCSKRVGSHDLCPDHARAKTP